MTDDDEYKPEYKLSFNAREMQIIYIALTKIWWSGGDVKAEYSVRYKLEKRAQQATGVSLHDFLEEHGAISDVEKPLTLKEKIKELNAKHREAKAALIKQSKENDDEICKR